MKCWSWSNKKAERPLHTRTLAYTGDSCSELSFILLRDRKVCFFVLATIRGGREGHFARQENKPELRMRGSGAHTNFHSGTCKSYCFSLDGHLRPLHTQISAHWGSLLVRILQLGGGPYQGPSFFLTRRLVGSPLTSRMTW
jgi:hypothetical protein